MRIGIVLSNTPGYSETFFLSKIKGLQAQGHQVILFTQTNNNNFTLWKVKASYPIFKRNLVKQMAWFLVVFFKMLGSSKAVWLFIKLEKKQKTPFSKILKKLYASAHILTEQLDWLHFGFATMALGKENVAKSIGANMAVSLRGFDIAIYPVKNPNCYRLLWRNVDKVHTISNDLLDLAYHNGLSKEVPVQKITPAIDTNFFNNSKQVFKADECLKLFTVARLHWKKGLSYILRALAILKQQGVNFEYTIVGEGAQYEELRYTIHLLNLEAQVSLLGKQTPKEIKDLMKTNQVYVQYSISEGFCNAVLEAQAMGLLCVVSDAEGLSENVLHKETGWVVPKYNAKALADEIIKVLNLDEKEKLKIIENAKIRVKQEFNIEKQQEEFIQFYS